MKSRTLRSILVCTLLLAGTAAQASPQDDLAEGQAAVINALVAGADSHAPQLLDSARSSLQMARDSIARNDFERAQQLTRRAFAQAAEAESRALLVREASLAPKRPAARP